MPSFFKQLGRFFTGTPEKRENVSTLRPEQEGLYNQLVGAGQGPGAGGAFGQSADYYRNLLGDNSADFNAFAAPQLRQYSQDIVPGISEQFAAMGAGGSGLNSSAFQNAQVQGATDLAERLGSIRANLRQAGAQGLQNIGTQGLQPYSQNVVTQPGSEGLLRTALPAGLSAAGALLGGPALGAAGFAAGNAVQNWFGKTSPYGSKGPQASPQVNPQASPNIRPGGTGFQLPGQLQFPGRGY